MAFISLKCPSCNADIDLDESRESAFCSYCGTRVVQDKQVVELKGKIKVDGISTADKLLERAYILVEDKDYIQAEKSFDKVLEIEPKCADAYWGKMLCEFEVPDVKTAEKYGVDITCSNNYKRAVSFASENKKEKYIDYGKKTSGKHLKNKMVSLASKTVFAIIPVVAFCSAAFQTGPNNLLTVLLSLGAFLWGISYFISKKTVAKKKSNRNLWLIFGGVILIISIFISCSERVPSDEAIKDTTTVAITENYSEL